MAVNQAWFRENLAIPVDRLRMTVSLCFALVLAFGVVKCGAGEDVRSTELVGRTRSPVYGKSGAVSSSQPLATSIGIEMLKSGGNAADTAVAVAAALSVLEPMSGGPGGDVSILYWDEKSARLYGLDSSGRPPVGLPQALAEQQKGADAVDSNAVESDGDAKAAVIPDRGPLTWTVPGAVDGWEKLHSRFGSRPWEELFQPAIQLAKEGFPVTPASAHRWNAGRDRLSGTGAVVLLKGSEVVRPGQLVVNEDLGRTLEAIATGGRDTFYSGDLGQTLVAFGVASGAALSLDDLAAHQATWSEPISLVYRDDQISVLPSSQTGVTLLETLGVLAAYNLAEIGQASPQYWHLLIEAKRSTVAAAAAEQPAAERLTAEALAERRRAIDPNMAGQGPVRLAAGSGAIASVIAVIDAGGNACILIQDLGASFGSGVVPGAMGFVMQGRLAGRVQAEAAKPVAHHRVPVLAIQEGKPSVLMATGGRGDTAEVAAQSLVSRIDFDLDPQSVLDRARVMVDPSDAAGRRLLVEPGVAEEVVAELKIRGHDVVQAASVGASDAQLIVVLPSADGGGSVISAGSDPRNDSTANAF